MRECCLRSKHPITRNGANPMDIDTHLLDEVAKVAAEAGDRLLAVYSPDARPADRGELTKAAIRNEEVSSRGLREALYALRPEARWLEEENETGALPDGEWWVVDDAEGSVNQVHGLPEWGVSISLVVDGVPELGVFRQPVADLTYTALRAHGGYKNGAHENGAHENGAHENGGRRLTVSRKSGLEVAIVGTGQAEAGQAETYTRIGRSIAALPPQAFLVPASVPSPSPLLLVA